MYTMFVSCVFRWVRSREDGIRNPVRWFHSQESHQTACQEYPTVPVLRKPSWQPMIINNSSSQPTRPIPKPYKPCQSWNLYDAGPYLWTSLPGEVCRFRCNASYSAHTITMNISDCFNIPFKQSHYYSHMYVQSLLAN